MSETETEGDRERDTVKERERKKRPDKERDTEIEREKESKGEREKEIKERERDYKFIQKHSRGLNRDPARTYIFASLNHLSYRCQRQRQRETERGTQ